MSEEKWGQWRSQILARVNSIKFKTKPFYHFYCEPFLPTEMYNLLERVWPNDKYFWGQKEIANTPLQHEEANLRKVVIIDDAPGFAETSDAISFWKNFRELIKGPLLLNAIVEKSIENIAEVRTDLDIKDTKFWSNALLETDSNGFKLGPHVDARHCLMSFLLYLPPNTSMESLGTSIFRPKQGFLTKNPNLMEDFSTNYFDENDFDEIDRAPYRPNGLFGIINEPRAFHGVKELEHLRFGRRHMLWSITNKEDNPYPSALERIKRGITPENQRIKNRLEEFMAQKY
jgi:hypothetical protein